MKKAVVAIFLSISILANALAALGGELTMAGAFASIGQMASPLLRCNNASTAAVKAVTTLIKNEIPIAAALAGVPDAKSTDDDCAASSLGILERGVRTLSHVLRASADWQNHLAISYSPSVTNIVQYSSTTAWAALICLFLLMYLVVLSQSNLPWAIAKAVHTLKPDVDRRRVFHLCAQHETKLGGESPLREQVAGTSSEMQGKSREAIAERSVERTSEPTHRNRIRGDIRRGERANDRKAPATKV